MDVVIDANVLGDYYKVAELGHTNGCTADPSNLFESLGHGATAFLDQGKMIETEWRGVADTEWFDAWLAERFENDAIAEINVDGCSALIRRLERNCGFPKGSRDRWYIRTARSRSTMIKDDVMLVSEDADLFEPKAKSNPKQRRRLIQQCKGSVAKELGGVGVQVRCVAATDT